MNYSELKDCDIANGPGVRVSLFVSGCHNHCKGCFNESTWYFDSGKPFTKEVAMHIMKLLDRDYIDGFSVLGGDPCAPENIKPVTSFCWYVKQQFPEKSIWVYSGYTYEQLMKREDFKSLYQCIDILVDGPYVEELRDISLQFRGSSNQRIIDIPRTIKEGKVVLWHDNDDSYELVKHR